MVTRLIGPAIRPGGQPGGKLNEIQEGRFNRFLQKFLAIKGTAPSPTLSTDISLHFSINLLPDVWVLQDWQPFVFAPNPTASAGNFQRAEVRNPKTSNVIALIYRASINTAGASDAYSLIQFQNATTDQGTVTIANQLDRRGKPNSAMVVSHNNGAAPVAPGGGQANYYVTNSVTNTGKDFLLPGEFLILAPGDAWVLQDTALATGANMSFVWIERGLGDSELKL